MELDSAIQKRKSVRKFNLKKKPDWRTIIECIDSARFAPMAGNNYTLKFILIDDEEKIKEITESCHQNFVSESKYVVVACSDPSRTVNLFGEAGKVYSRQQAGAAIENFLLKITESGLSTCWVGKFVEEQVKKVLGIPENVNIEAIFPIGYNAETLRTRVAKIDLNRILYFNSYGNVKMKKIHSTE